MMFIGVNAFLLQKRFNLNPMLPTDLEDCPAGTDFSKALNSTLQEVPTVM